MKYRIQNFCLGFRMSSRARKILGLIVGNTIQAENYNDTKKDSDHEVSNFIITYLL